MKMLTKIPIQYKSHGSKKWNDMTMWGETVEQLVEKWNAHEKTLPFGIRCEWRVPPLGGPAQ